MLGGSQDLFRVNTLTFDPKPPPKTEPQAAKYGGRIRLAKLSIDHQPIHLHEFSFRVKPADCRRTIS